MRIPFKALLAAGWAAVVLNGSAVLAFDRPQTIPVAYGWNAVWLEVSPRGPDGSRMAAEKVFASPDFVVDRIAAPVETERPERYVTQPTPGLVQRGWRLWSRNPGAGETGTILVDGHRPFLIHVSKKDGTILDGPPAGSITVVGRASFYRPAWDRDRYNLLGFGIQGRVTFNEALGASGWSAAASPAYRLDPATGNWRVVEGSDSIEPGQAYWMSLPFQLPDTRYAGPVSVEFTGSSLGRLDFGPGPGTADIANPLGDPATLSVSVAELTMTRRQDGMAGVGPRVTLARIRPADTEPAVSEMRVFPLERVPGELRWQAYPTTGGASWDLGTIDTGTSRSVALGLNRNWTLGDTREHLYQIRIQLGSGSLVLDLPISASSPGRLGIGSSPGAASSLPGLWVGTIVADQVTSLTTTNGHPSVVPTTSSASISLMIHVGTNGVPVLLSRAMLMQTRTADPSVPATPVLILSESQIPFFEGIEERRGKKVGVRFETPFFDMPRDWSPKAQKPELIAAVREFRGDGSGQAGMQAQDLFDYLKSLKQRPPILNEVYCDRWPLEGVWAPGGGAGTSQQAPLLLDPFHRSNPFRHAFHPQHGTGYPVRRSFAIRLDNVPFQGELTGDFEETLSGLATQDLVYRGRLSMRRVSNVTFLQ